MTRPRPAAPPRARARPSRGSRTTTRPAATAMPTPAAATAASPMPTAVAAAAAAAPSAAAASAPPPAMAAAASAPRAARRAAARRAIPARAACAASIRQRGPRRRQRSRSDPNVSRSVVPARNHRAFARHSVQLSSLRSRVLRDCAPAPSEHAQRGIQACKRTLLVQLRAHEALQALRRRLLACRCGSGRRSGPARRWWVRSGAACGSHGAKRTRLRAGGAAAGGGRSAGSGASLCVVDMTRE
jgi:hypothetical protein